MEDAMVSSISYHWYPKTPDQVHMWVTDDTITDEHGQRPGLHIVFSSNDLSANYNPAYYNRIARHLRDQGKPAPAEVPVYSRRLIHRRIVRKAIELGIPPQDVTTNVNLVAHGAGDPDVTST
jgi:hypothetical protein